MATDPHLLERTRNILAARKTEWSEKKMFGGDCFMVDGKMLIGTYKGGIMARIEPEEAETLTKRPGAEQMVHGGRPMTGYLFITEDGFDADDDLAFWIDKCLEFNPKARSSKKKKK
ncbi:MAG: TfoX/Sxy family protein [Saprospiraceae bacterium]|nr:TfoX/Sxy family protein [Saprospiraceae bacterium]